MKKRLAVLMTLCLMVSMSACSDNEKGRGTYSEDIKASDKEEKEDKKEKDDKKEEEEKDGKKSEEEPAEDPEDVIEEDIEEEVLRPAILYLKPLISQVRRWIRISLKVQSWCFLIFGSPGAVPV